MIETQDGPSVAPDGQDSQAVAASPREGLEERTLSKEKQAAFLKEMKERYDRGYEMDEADRAEALQDLEFGILAKQWPDALQADRENDGRPCLVINKLPEMVDSVIGGIRSSDATVKLKARGNKRSSRRKTEVVEGLVKAIMATGDASIASDEAAESAVWCGRGFYRILTRYIDDDSFDQEAYLEPIKERFSVVWDPEAKRYDLSDGNWMFVESKMQRADYESEYGDEHPVDWETSAAEWQSDKEIRVVEYFWKEPKQEKLYLLKDGLVSNARPDDAALIVRERTITKYKIMWAKATSTAIIEGPRQVAGDYIPIVPVWGKEATISGKRYTRGAIRYARDPQRVYNYMRSTEVETVALQPRVPWLLTAKMIDGYKALWDASTRKNLPYLPYNPDDQAPGNRPHREAPPAMPTGFMQEAQLADADIRGTVGLHAPSLGEPDQHKSGKAIALLQNKGDLGSFAFIDNVNMRSMKHAGRIIVSMIPYIYDTERKVDILENDGKTTSAVTINQQAPGPGEEPVDLTDCKFDVVVDTGPNYATQRAESMDFWLNFIRTVPNVAQYLGDIIMRNADIKDADEAESRMRKLLPPGMVKPREGEELPGQDPQNGPGGQPPVDPMQEQLAEIQMKKEMAQLAAAEWEIENKRQENARLKALAEKARLETVAYAAEHGLEDIVAPDLPAGQPGGGA